MIPDRNGMKGHFPVADSSGRHGFCFTFFLGFKVLGKKRKLVAKILKIRKDHAKMQISGLVFSKTDLAAWERPTSQHDVSKHLPKLRIH